MSSYLLATMLLAAAPPCGPLDLDTALGLAVTRSDEVAIKQAELSSAHADESLARALRIAPVASATLVTGPSPEARGTVLKSEDSNRALTGLRPFGRVEIEVLQPLYTWGRLDAASEAARAGISARESLVQDTTSQVQFRVAQLYWGVSLARRLLAVANDVKGALAQADEHIREALAAGDTDISRRPLPGRALPRRRERPHGGGAEGPRARAGRAGCDPGCVLAEAPVEGGAAQSASRRTAQSPTVPGPPAAATRPGGARRRHPGPKMPRRRRSRRASRSSSSAGQFKYSYAPNRDFQLNPWVHDPFNESFSVGAVLGLRQDLAFPMLSARAQKALAERATLDRQRAGLSRLVEVQVDGALAELRAAHARHVAAQASLGSGKALFRSTGLDFAAGLVDAKTIIESYHCTWRAGRGGAGRL